MQFATGESFVPREERGWEGEEDNHRQIKKNLCRGGSAPIKLQQIKYGGNTSSGKMADQNKTTKHNRATKWAATTTRQRRSDKGCSVWAATTFSEGSKRAQTVKLTPPFGKRRQKGEKEGGLMAATCCRELEQKVTHRPPQGSRGRGEVHDNKGLVLISQVAHTPRERR